MFICVYTQQVGTCLLSGEPWYPGPNSEGSRQPLLALEVESVSTHWDPLRALHALSKAVVMGGHGVGGFRRLSVSLLTVGTA